MVCTASDINQTQTPSLRYVSSARARRVRARYRTIYSHHDIVRLTNPRSISQYRVIDMITNRGYFLCSCYVIRFCIEGAGTKWSNFKNAVETQAESTMTWLSIVVTRHHVLQV